MPAIIREILRKKFVENVSTLELFDMYPEHEREVVLIALSELPMGKLTRYLSANPQELREIFRFKQHVSKNW